MSLNVIIGQNQSLIERKIQELSTNFRQLIYNNNFHDFFLELQKITNQFLFGKKNDIVLKNLAKIKKNDLQILVEFLKSNSDLNFIFVFPDEPTEFLDLLRKNKLKFKVFQLRLPDKRSLENFIAQYAQEHNLKLSPEIIKVLKENYQDNIDLLLADLEKIALLGGDQKSLKQILHFKTNVFKIQDYFLERNWPLFIHHFKKFILEDKSKDNADSLRALSLLFHSLVKIYLIKKGKIGKIKTNDYYLQKLKEKSKNLTLEEIKLLISVLAKTDKKFKKFYLNIKEIPEDISLNYLLSKS
ncbi:MAG: hypothetical protein KatS3mg096_086 [Candidatus Parcubacteria bacterium]|nr:MAG: hypothetical protein KatS3mg096_086 [Candidatus Parcubacteria bacterium]